MLCVLSSVTTRAEELLARVPLRISGRDSLRVLVATSDTLEVASGCRLLLVQGTDPVTWADYVESVEGVAVFNATDPQSLRAVRQGAIGWLIPPSFVGGLLEVWPRGAGLFAAIDAIGPGGQFAWIRAGRNQGVNVGDSWWLRLGGQPAVRLDVDFVAEDVCYCAIIPLALNPRLRVGDRVAFWPSPGERRRGRASSAVSYIEDDRSGGALVWVAAPPNVACPAEPHLDFFREGRFLGHGLVQRRDSRFWYARFTPASLAAAGEPASQPATGPAGVLRVGDEVMIRTLAALRERRFVMRVFERTPNGFVINGGEADGLVLNQELYVCRQGAVAGRALTRDVQRSYAVVAAAPGPDGTTTELRLGDELRVEPPPPPLTVVAVVRTVTQETLFTADIQTGEPPLQTPLAVRAAGRTVGVAILVAADERRVCGFVLPNAMTRALSAGMLLSVDSEPRPSLGE